MWGAGVTYSSIHSGISVYTTPPGEVDSNQIMAKCSCVSSISTFLSQSVFSPREPSIACLPLYNPPSSPTDLSSSPADLSSGPADLSSGPADLSICPLQLTSLLVPSNPADLSVSPLQPS
jgi:hypothetical protein